MNIIFEEQKLLIKQLQCPVEFETCYSKKVYEYQGLHPSCCDGCTLSKMSITNCILDQNKVLE